MELPKLSPKQSDIEQHEAENNNVSEWSAHNEVKLVQQQQHQQLTNSIIYHTSGSSIPTKTEPCDALFPHCHSSLLSSIVGQTPFSYPSSQASSAHHTLFNYNNHQEVHNQLHLHQRQQQQQHTALQDGESHAVRGSKTDFKIGLQLDEASMSSVADADEQVAHSNVSANQISDVSSVECVVCCDKSSGKHYGQFTCEGCKSFFKRSVRRNLSYSCRGNRSCPVDIQHRNQCQYCRYQKCIKLGMRREAVQRGRVPPSGSGINYGLLNGYPSTEWSDSSTGSTPPQLAYCLSSFVHALIKADRGGYHQPNGSGHGGLDMIAEQSTRILITAVQFVKHMPHFSDLHLADQVALLQHCWHQLFILSAAQASLHIPPASLMTSVQMNAGSERVQVYIDTLRMLPEIMEKLKQLQTDIGEYACLKALVVFNSDLWTLQDSQSVEAIQEKVQCALEEYCRIQYPSQPARFGRLLMRLPVLHFISQQAIEQLFFLRLLHNTSMDSILREILLGPVAPTNNIVQHSILQHQHHMASHTSTPQQQPVNTLSLALTNSHSLPQLVLPSPIGGISSDSSYSMAAAVAYLPSIARPSSNL